MQRDGNATTSVTAAAMTGRRHKAMAFVLAGGLLLAPAATLAIPQSLPLAQEEATETSRLSNGQVIAQGVARLQPDEIAWTVRRIDVSGTEPTPVGAFQTGFVLSDAASVVVLGPNEQVLGVLDEGEAVFLAGGDAGGLAPWRDPEASLFELALVSGEEAAAGQTSGTVVGSPFAKPDGRDFEIELARHVLDADDESVIPASRSGTPVLFVQTDGTSELTPPDGAPVEISAGQYAVLVGDVSARGAGSEPAAFVVAAIGERMPARSGSANARAGGGANRANRANRGGGSADRQADRAAQRAARQAARQQGGGGGGGGGNAEERAARQAAREARRAERAARQAEREANRGQTPVAGTPAAGTPTPVEEPQDATPAPTTDPSAGTPTPPATPPAEEEDDEVIQDDTPARDDEVDQDDEVVQDDDEVIQDDEDVIQDDDEVVQDDPPADEEEVVQDDDEVVQDEPPAAEEEIVQDDEPVIQDDTETGGTTEPEQTTGDEMTPEEGGVEASSLAPDVPVEPAEPVAPEATLPVVEVPPADVPAVEPPAVEAPVDQAPVVEAPPVVEDVPVTDAPVEQAPVE